MFKKISPLLFVPVWLLTTSVFAQQQKIADSLLLIYRQNNLKDSVKMTLLRDLSFNENRDYTKGLWYAEELIDLAKKTGDIENLRIGYFLKGTKHRLLGSLDDALAAYIKSLEIAHQMANLLGEGEAYSAIGDIYFVSQNYPNALLYYRRAITTLKQSGGNSVSIASVLLNLGEAFRINRNYDSALYNFNEAKLIFDKQNHQSGIGYSLGNIGMVYASTGQNSLAEKNMKEAIRMLEETQDYYPICEYLLSMADVYLQKGDTQGAMEYTLQSNGLAEKYGLKQQVATASLKLSELHEQSGNIALAFKYYKNHIANRDSVMNIESVQKMADLRTNYEVSQKQAEVNMLNQKRKNQRTLVLSLAIILTLAVVILIILLKNNKHKKKAYRILKLQKKETELQKAKAEETLNALQQTQKQMIQSAKMASLGELTAGIAHELKNPLNFVNNFSEVSIELLVELCEGALTKLPPNDKDDADFIMKDLVENLKKINNHGKRADGIVKAMLQHARASTGRKEPTEINALVNEYLRLSYHGLSAQEKETITKIISNYDATISKLDVIPEDIGRVLLNLFNNAFYAVIKKKELSGDQYIPTIGVTTKHLGQSIEISVRDNGIGIPQKVQDKIFQPFFTTKPTGQGTGLGLSLSYDVIMAHGGELKMETKEGEFTEFKIQLPIGNGIKDDL